MSDAEVETKFRLLAAGVLSPPKVDRLLEKLWTLDALADAGDIVRLTHAGAP
jgi:hypothetical protein